MPKTLGEVHFHIIVTRAVDGVVTVNGRGDYTVGTTDDPDLSKQRTVAPTIPAAIVTTLTDRMNTVIVPAIKTAESIP